MKKYLRENLIKVETFIEEFDLGSDRINAEFNINEITFEQLRVIFENRDRDEDLYLSYEVNESIASAINSMLKTPIPFDFSKYCYYLQRYGEYDYT